MKSRPAEVTGGLVGLATAIAALAGASTAAVAIVGTVAGLVPSVVTLLVTHGGIRGVLRAVWGGRPTDQGYTVLEALGVVLIAILLAMVAVAIFHPHNR